jgi:hypothetical protein
MIANPRRLGNTQTASNLVHTPLSPCPPSHTASHFAPAHTHHHSPFPAPRLVESAPCVPGIPAGTDSRRPRCTKATSHSASVLARARGPFAQSSWLSSVRVWEVMQARGGEEDDDEGGAGKEMKQEASLVLAWVPRVACVGVTDKKQGKAP